MKVKIEGHEYEVMTEEMLYKKLLFTAPTWKERWLSLPAKWFAGAQRDVMAKLQLNHVDSVMVISPELFERMNASSISSEAKKD